MTLTVTFIFKNNIQGRGGWDGVNDDEVHYDHLLSGASSERLKNSGCTATLQEG